PFPYLTPPQKALLSLSSLHFPLPPPSIRSTRLDRSLLPSSLHHTPPTPFPLRLRIRRHASLLRWLLNRREGPSSALLAPPETSRVGRPAVDPPPPRGPLRPPRRRCCSTARTRSPPPAAPSAARPRPTGWRACCCTSAATIAPSTTTTPSPTSPRPAPPPPIPLDRLAIPLHEPSHLLPPSTISPAISSDELPYAAPLVPIRPGCRLQYSSPAHAFSSSVLLPFPSVTYLPYPQSHRALPPLSSSL
ncbi:hypothetical protein PENTCL1PPCAC_5829, partial [Pristionchus entomophagus]